MEIVSKSLQETQKAAKLFLKGLSSEGAQAAVVGLKGDLGSGKTTFTQAIAKELGIRETVTSPTFVILKKYGIPQAGDFETLVHIDAYRLEDPKELNSLEFKREVSDPKNLILIEWPENVSEALPADAYSINFEFIDEGVRRIHWLNK